MKKFSAFLALALAIVMLASCCLAEEKPDPFGKYDEPVTVHFVRSTDDTLDANFFSQHPDKTMTDNLWCDLYRDTLNVIVDYDWIVKGGDEYVISTVERAMVRDTASEETAAAPAPEEGNGWLRDLHAYIHAHLNEDLSLNRLAEYCHFHPVYLSRVYKESTGMTLSDYINQVRLEQAEQLLRNSRLTVLDISRLMGFATDNYFCRWFRKRTGISPHSYRNGKK